MYQVLDSQGRVATTHATLASAQAWIVIVGTADKQYTIQEVPSA